MNQPPIAPYIAVKTIKISCFVCAKNFDIELRPLQAQKTVSCPVCNKKEVIIISN